MNKCTGITDNYPVTHEIMVICEKFDNYLEENGKIARENYNLLLEMNCIGIIYVSINNY